jgi:hypothetical protein
VVGRRHDVQQPNSHQVHGDIASQQPSDRAGNPDGDVHRGERDAEPRRLRTHGGRRRLQHLPHRHVRLRDDVALTDAAALTREQERFGHVLDTDDLGGHSFDERGDLAERGVLHHQPLVRLPIARPVRVRDAHGDRRQTTLTRIGQHHILCLAARLDVRSALAVPVERHVLGHRGAPVTDRDGADGAAEHEPVQVGVDRDVEHTPQAFDIGFEQRRRVA